METDIQVMHSVWQNNKFGSSHKKDEVSPKFEDLVSSIFHVGPFYFYVIDFVDMSLSHFSQQVEEIHGIPISEFKNINNILALIHPDDIAMVARLEEQAYGRLLMKLGVEKTTRYKISYNFRFKTADGSYKLFNHQALILQIDEKGGIIHSLNIHTQINHISTDLKNTYSLIGLMGEPSFYNIAVEDNESKSSYKPTANNGFSNRELQVIQLLAKGKSNTEIASQLSISPNTVKNHRKKILHKANCKNVQQLVAMCVAERLI